MQANTADGDGDGEDAVGVVEADGDTDPPLPVGLGLGVGVLAWQAPNVIAATPVITIIATGFAAAGRIMARSVPNPTPARAGVQL